MEGKIRCECFLYAFKIQCAIIATASSKVIMREENVIQGSLNPIVRLGVFNMSYNSKSGMLSEGHFSDFTHLTCLNRIATSLGYTYVLQATQINRYLMTKANDRNASPLYEKRMKCRCKYESVDVNLFFY